MSYVTGLWFLDTGSWSLAAGPDGLTIRFLPVTINQRPAAYRILNPNWLIAQNTYLTPYRLDTRIYFGETPDLGGN